MADPQQEIFARLRTGLEKAQPYKVYDGFLPPDGTPYPFVYLADSQQLDAQTKGQVIGTVNQTVKVWIDSPRKRGTLSDTLGKIKAYVYSIERTKSYAWAVQSLTQRIIPDTTVNPPLMQGIIEITFRFS